MKRPSTGTKLYFCKEKLNENGQYLIYYDVNTTRKKCEKYCVRLLILSEFKQIKFSPLDIIRKLGKKKLTDSLEFA